MALQNYFLLAVLSSVTSSPPRARVETFSDEFERAQNAAYKNFSNDNQIVSFEKALHVKSTSTAANFCRKKILW